MGMEESLTRRMVLLAHHFPQRSKLDHADSRSSGRNLASASRIFITSKIK